MKNIIPFSDKKIINKEASDWFAKLHRGELTQQQRSDLHGWLMQNPRHGHSLIQMAELWDDMHSLSLLAELIPVDCDPRAVSNNQSFISIVAKPSMVVVTALAASVILVFSLIFMSATDQQVKGKGSPVSEPYELVYHAKLGEQSLAQLSDGSSILLNTQTTIKVRFDDSERAVELIEGEAHFDVAKNPEIPFVVYAGNGRIRAVGTAFSVRLDQQRVGVTVTEGVVQVSSDVNSPVKNATGTTTTVKTVTLRQNGEAYYRDSIEDVGYIDAHALEKKLAWKSGKWLFDGARLDEVIKEANRYLDIKLVIGDPSIANLQVGGYFNIGDIDPLLSALEKGLGVTALPRNGGQIALIARSRH